MSCWLLLWNLSLEEVHHQCRVVMIIIITVKPSSHLLVVSVSTGWMWCDWLWCRGGARSGQPPRCFRQTFFPRLHRGGDVQLGHRTKFGHRHALGSLRAGLSATSYWVMGGSGAWWRRGRSGDPSDHKSRFRRLHNRVVITRLLEPVQAFQICTHTIQQVGFTKRRLVSLRRPRRTLRCCSPDQPAPSCRGAALRPVVIQHR